MNLSTKQSKVLGIKQGDKGFKFTENLVEYPRAAISVSNDCPPEVRLQLQVWVSNGWIAPVAYVRESEYIWEKLQE